MVSVQRGAAMAEGCVQVPPCLASQGRRWSTGRLQMTCTVLGVWWKCGWDCLLTLNTFKFIRGMWFPISTKKPNKPNNTPTNQIPSENDFVLKTVLGRCLPCPWAREVMASLVPCDGCIPRSHSSTWMGNLLGFLYLAMKMSCKGGAAEMGERWGKAAQGQSSLSVGDSF